MIEAARVNHPAPNRRIVHTPRSTANRGIAAVDGSAFADPTRALRNPYPYIPVAPPANSVGRGGKSLLRPPRRSAEYQQRYQVLCTFRVAGLLVILRGIAREC